MQRFILALLTIAAAATPAAAQEWLVNRERFRYIGTRLSIDVTTEAAGRLQIVRGGPGIVSVAGRVPVGFAGSGLSNDGRLTLTAAGSGPVDFLVVVPARVWIEVRLPDSHRAETVGAHTRIGEFAWGGPAAASAGTTAPAAPAAPAALPAPIAAALAEPGGALGDGLFVTYSAARAPASITLPDLDAVRTVSVRTGGDLFRIGTSRPLAMQPGSARSLEIRPAGEPIDIVIEIPAGTAEFLLSARGAAALTVRRGVVTSTCSPLTRQWLSSGREWVTFNPVHGQLDCRADTARHEG